jgi:hypothetical protein
MNQQQKIGARTDVFFMVISALLFAWFGFGSSWAHQYTTTQPPQLLLMVVVLKWTLRGGAIAFGLSVILALTGSILGELLYAIAGLATAVLFAIVAIWEWTNPQGYYSGVPAFLLIIFAVWNGYGSWISLRAITVMRRSMRRDEETFGPP